MKRSVFPPSSPTPEPLIAWLQRLGGARPFEALAGLLPQAAVFAVDEQGRILYWSAGCEALLGYTAAAVLGRSGLSGPPEAAPLGEAGIGMDRQEPERHLQMLHANGKRLSVKRISQSLFHPDGRFEGAVALLQPLTEAPGLEPLSLVPGVVSFHGLVTRDPAMLKAIEIIRNVAETDATVLVRGASGSGKELVARALHDESHRRHGPFVAVNCGALTPSLLESELFGHVKGAFTGAMADRSGIFVQANHGTLFLDEIAELPLELQPKLLRVLQERTVLPVGSNKPLSVDVRVVAATHRALRDEVKAGRFREDLMYRLRVVPIFLPTLKERPADIELLLQHFIEKANRRGPRAVQGVEPDAMRAMLAHPWPGNVRELQNVVDYAFAVGRGPLIRLSELPPEFREHRDPELLHDTPSDTGPSREPLPPPALLPPLSAATEEARLREALQLSQGNLNEAALRMGLSRTTFWRLRRRYGL